MATSLETLELKISANAQEAVKGLDVLISSLSKFSDALAKPYSDLRDFNEELRKLKGMSKINISINGTQSFKNVEKNTSAVTKATSATQKQLSVSAEAAKEFANMATNADALVFKQSQVLKQLARELGKKDQDEGKIGSLIEKYKKLTTAIDEAAKAKEKASLVYNPNGVNADVNVNELEFNNKSDEQWHKELKENTQEYLANRKRIQEETQRYRARIRAEQAEERRQAQEQARLAQQAAEARGVQAMSMVNESSSADLLRQKLQGMIATYVQEAKEGKLTYQQMAEKAIKIQELTKKYEELTKETKETRRASESLAKLKDSLTNAFDGVTKAINRITRIATTMLIRKAIKGLVKGIKEGINNLYEWSKATNKVFYNDMNSAKASILTLKNSLGAALSPMIQALIPLFRRLSSAIIEAANWVNQFISLLTGKTSWTKAIEQNAEDMEESAHSATSAAKEMLAAFDELNVISSAGGGGGASQTQEDYENMFTEITKFDEKIREIVNFLKDNLESIEGIALGIGAALFAWKFADAFMDALPVLSSLLGLVDTVATIAITLQATWLLTNQYLNTGEAGWLIADALTTAVGATAAYEIAKRYLNPELAPYVLYLTLTLSALTGIKAVLDNPNVSAFSKESLTALFENALKAGVATGLLLKMAGGASTIVATAGGATAAVAVFSVALGLKAALDPNVELFSLEHLATTVAASVISGFAMFLFTGSVIPAGITAIGIFSTLIALKLWSDIYHIEYGDLNLTQEQIQQYVKGNMFTADTDVYITKLNAILDNKESLEQSLRDQIASINNELNVLNLGIDTEASKTKIAEMINGKDGQPGLVQSIQQYADVNIDLLKLNFSNIKAYNSSGNEIDQEILLSAIPAWQEIKNEMEANGNKLTELLFKGAKEKLTPEEEAYEAELLEKIMNMGTRMANSQEFATTSAEFMSAALSAMNKNSIEGITAAFGQYSSENEETIRAGLLSTIAGYYQLADFTNDPEMQAYWRDLADQLAAGMETTVSNELKERTSPGRQLIMDWLNGNHDDPTLYDNSWKTILEKEGLTSDNLKSAIRDTLKLNGFTKEELELLDVINVSGWELLSDDVKQKLLKGIKITPETVAILKEQCEMDAEELFSVSNWQGFTVSEQLKFVKAVSDAFGTEEAIAAAQKAGMDVSALISCGMRSSDSGIREAAAEWAKVITDGIADEDTAKDAGKKCIQNIDKGIQEEVSSTTGGLTGFKAKIIEFAKDKTAGQEAGKAFSDGMHDKTSAVAEKAKEWKSGIQTELSSITAEGKVTASLTYDNTAATNTVNKLAKKVTDKTPKMTAALRYDPTANNDTAQKLAYKITSQKPSMVSKLQFNATTAENTANDLKKKITSKTAVMPVTGNVTDKEKNKIKGAIEKITPTVTVKGDIADSFASDVGKKVGDAVKKGLNGRSISINNDGNDKYSIAVAANGGIIDNGQMFIAREAGPELVGTMNGHTAVANNDQIVAGIESGVYRANAEQNALLRRQNEILLGILAKEGTVNIGASSALGRTVKRSLEMANAMGG